MEIIKGWHLTPPVLRGQTNPWKSSRHS
jgi:hypothetical protein